MGSSRVTLRIPGSIEEIEACIDAELFSRIAENGQNFDAGKLPFIPGEMYFLILADDTPIGFWLLYPANGSTLNIHCNIKQGYRQHGKAAARAILEWFVADCPTNYKKLNAEIPCCYPEVYHFTKKQGFTDEGINRLSILKQGQLVDQWRLGMTRPEVQNRLGETWDLSET